MLNVSENEKSDSMEQYPFRMIAPQQVNRDNLIIQTSPERVGELLEHELRGESFDYKTQSWSVTRKPLMNNEGIDTIITLVKQFLTQNSTLSNISDKMAKTQAYMFGNTLIDALQVNTKKWKLDKSIRSSLVVGITCMVYLVLTRSLGKLMSDKEMYATTISTQEHTLLKLGEDKKLGSGFFGVMNPFKKK